MDQLGIYGQGRLTWQRYKAVIIEVILDALSLLKEHDDLVANEVDLNRKLFFCFKRAARNRGLNYHLPTPEGNNPPYEDDKQRTVRENKRPDFYWQFCDDSVDDPKLCDRRFVLECKRLGSPRSSSPDWKLNQNYMKHGIARFLAEEHEYAKGDESAAMIGYVENMEFDVILREVNTHISSYSLSIPLLSVPEKDWQQNDVSQLEHTFVRTFPVSPFLLLHFWLDLRNHDLRLPESETIEIFGEKVDKELDEKGINERTNKLSKKKASKKTRQNAPTKEHTQLELPVDKSY